jgi:hypothetical protein
MGEVNILQLPKGYKLVSDLAFEYPQGKDEKFSSIVSRFDTYINEVRNDCIKVIAKKVGVDVTWEN